MKHEKKTYCTITTIVSKSINPTNSSFVCMKMSSMCVIRDLRRFEETDREEESLRFG